MMDQQIASRLGADLFLLHAPWSSDQIIPVGRPSGGRWLDDVTIPQQMIDDILAIPAGR